MALILKAGSIAHIEGVPVRLEGDVEIHTHPGNMEMLTDKLSVKSYTVVEEKREKPQG